MIVEVRLHANLRRPTSEGHVDRLTVELDEAATVASLLQVLSIDVAPESLLLLVNRRRVDPEDVLHDRDDVRLFPAISGGCDAPG